MECHSLAFCYRAFHCDEKIQDTIISKEKGNGLQVRDKKGDTQRVKYHDIGGTGLVAKLCPTLVTPWN